MKNIAVLLILVIGLFMNLSAPIKAPRLWGAEVEPEPYITFQDIPIETCTLKGVHQWGFPFRINLNDSCEQDESFHTVAILVNLTIWIGIAGLAYYLIDHTKKSNHKAQNKPSNKGNGE